MKLNSESLINNADLWREKGFVIPSYDTRELKKNTALSPEWLHIGPGNIFRGYIACLADDIIASSDMKTGIIAVECFDPDIPDMIYKPFDDLVILAGLKADGGKYLRVIGSIAGSVKAFGDGMIKLRRMAEAPSLKMISFTITEKGYACTDVNGNVFPGIASDITNGPDAEPVTAVGKVAAMLYERFRAGELPLALVSMDNCSRNGEKLRSGIMFIADGWRKKGFVTDGFISYLNDGKKISFPWSMIDKITPRPDPAVSEMLSGLGIENTEPIVTGRGTYIAPFVNAEMPQYLVIEDDFPNGRPALEKAGVFFTDRTTVNSSESMKVMTCLNPLHTSLAIFGCLLGFEKISDEMNDSDLKEMVYRLGYKEGLPVSADPGIIRPEDFLKEVLTERLPNPFLPDTPQRIATDTSQKIAVRFGGTIRAYEAAGKTDELEIIPLVIAGWFRYLLGTDDSGAEMQISADPMLEEMSAKLSTFKVGGNNGFTDKDRENIRNILRSSEIFGTDLVNAGLSDKIISLFESMTAGKGAVRKTLSYVLQK